MRGAPDPRSLQVDLTDRVARWLRKRKELRLLVDCIGCVRGFHIESNNAMGQPRIELNMEEDPRLVADIIVAYGTAGYVQIAIVCVNLYKAEAPDVL